MLSKSKQQQIYVKTGMGMRVKLNDKRRGRMKKLMRAKGVGTTALVSRAQSLRPEGLTAAIIYTWLAGRSTKMARRDHLAWVFKELRGTKPRVDITANKRLERLRWLMSQKKLGAAELVSRAQDPRPEGLTAGVIYTWLAGNTRTARRDHLAWVFKELRGTKTHADLMARGIKTRVDLIANERVDRLRRLMSQKKLGATLLFFYAQSPRPEGLTVPIIYNWLSGRAQTARRDHLAWVFKELRGVKSRVDLKATKSLDRLRRLMSEKKTDVAEIFFYPQNPPLEGLTGPVVYGWLSGKAQTARRDHLAWVFKELRMVAARQPRSKSKAKPMVCAVDVLSSAKLLVRNKGRAPDARDPEDYLCGLPAQEITQLFNESRVFGLEEFGLKPKEIRSLDDFLEAALPEESRAVPVSQAPNSGMHPL